MVDENAQIVDGDAIVAMCAKDMKNQGILQSSKVVMTVVSNLGYVHALREMGIEVVLSKVGDRFVLEEMVASHAILGGEPSGHILFLEHNTTGDGIVSALQVLKIMIETGCKLSELAAAYKKYPQSCINIPVKSKPPLESIEGLAQTIADVEQSLGTQGRVLVRYSGTEPKLRVLVEGPKRALVQEYSEKIAAVIRSTIGA
jgi:phosphoglucosamine mutase